MSNSKVMCQCCGKQMTPQVIESRGIYVGWKWGGRFGAGHVVGSVCPFCLSENWDGVQRPVHRSTVEKMIVLIALMIAGSLTLDMLKHIYAWTGKLAIYESHSTAIQWAVIFILFIAYRKLRLKRS